MTPVNIAGLGTWFPEGRKQNSDFDFAAAGVAPERVARSGIEERRWAAPSETILDLGEHAARAALRSGGIGPEQIDRLFLVTSTFQPDLLVPTGVAALHDRLGLRDGCHATTLVETCSGALVAMELGAALIRAGQARNVLVVCAETFSKTFNPSSPLSFEIGMAMGDGAGAVVLSGREDWPEGLLATLTRSSADFQGGLGIRPMCGEQDGVHAASLRFGVGSLPPRYRGEPLPKEQLVELLKRFTTACVPTVIADAIAAAGLGRADVDFFVLHQPNRMLVDAWRRAAEIPDTRTLDTLARYGNLSSVSLLANLGEAWRARRIKPGDTVVLASVGEGMSWGAAVWKWRLSAEQSLVAWERMGPCC